MVMVSDDDDGVSSANTYMSPNSGISPGYEQSQSEGPSHASTLRRTHSSSSGTVRNSGSGSINSDSGLKRTTPGLRLTKTNSGSSGLTRTMSGPSTLSGLSGSTIPHYNSALAGQAITNSSSTGNFGNMAGSLHSRIIGGNPNMSGLLEPIVDSVGNSTENYLINTTSDSTSYASNFIANSPQDKPIRRRKHKNSKLGCPNCKKRRVKCSEDLPSCMNCVKHKVKCGYLEYTEKELNEIRQYKLSNEFDDLSTDAKDSSFLDKKPRSKLVKSHSLPSNSAKEPEYLTSKSLSVSDSFSTQQPRSLAQPLSESLNQVLLHSQEVSRDSEIQQNHDLPFHELPEDPEILPRHDLQTIANDLRQPQTKNSSAQLDLDMNNVLNIAHNSITQNFDNLLGNARTDEIPIIYPVYSINTDSHSSSGYMSDANPYFVPKRDVFSGQVNPSDNASSHFFNATNVTSTLNLPPTSLAYNSDHSMTSGPSTSSIPTYGLELSSMQPPRQTLQNSQNFQAPTPAYDNILSNRFGYPEGNHSLPGALTTPTSFVIIPRDNTNYQLKLISLVKEIGASIAAGTSLLPQIRILYITWLNSFIDHSYSSDLMFSCLLNLTTNYLICNVFGSCPTYRRLKSKLQTGLLPYQQVGEFSLFIDKSKTKNSAIVKSIKYYAKVIKDLRILLNKNDNPELCSSVSYILSLMSIYDPEATLNSTICFRDGLFSILSYNLNLSLKKGEKVPLLIPVHLKLMKNIARSIYLPGYDPSFLFEFKSVLTNFAEMVIPVLERVKQFTLSQNLPPIHSAQFVKLKLFDLLEFVNATIDKHVPVINGNLDDMNIQEEVLFDMLYKWVRLFPSRLTVISRDTDLLEKVLYLFYKVFKKSLFAIFPQVKYHFLRDFDSPIMTDVFTLKNDVDILLHEMDHSVEGSILDEYYQPLIPHLKFMSAYLIRMNTFLSKRIMLLYRYIVYEEIPQKMFPINDMRTWRDSIKGVAQTRSDFNKVIGLHELPIKSFLKTPIRKIHYPKIVNESNSDYGDDEIEIEIDLDMTQLQLDGLLAQDFRFP